MSAGTHKPAEALHQKIDETQTQRTEALARAGLTAIRLAREGDQQAAETIRAQHARIAELESQLEAIGAGGVEPLRKPAAATQAVQAAVPDGWKLVPLNPTAEMCKAANLSSTNRQRWADMLAAAPAHPAEGVPAQAAKLPPLPEPTAFLVCKGSEVTARAWNVDQMRAYAAAALAATQPAAQGVEQDAARYQALVESGNFAPSLFDNGMWGLRASSAPSTKAELDAAVDRVIAAQAKQGEQAK